MRRREPLPRLGLHDREPPGADQAAAVDPRPLLRRARRPQPARPQGRRRGARSSTSPRRATCPGIGRRVGGHRRRCRAGSTSPGCPPGGALQAEQARPAGAHAPATSSRRRSSASCRTAPRPRPARPLLFGHGLFQDATAVDSIALFAPVSNAVICGTNFGGMSQEDLVNDAKVSADLSRFPEIADRLQQGILDFMFLGRAMIHPQGFSSNPEFAGRIDTRPALLRRRQPGRHHRRRAHRGRARLRPLGADRARAALQPAAHAQHAVPDLRADPLRQVPRPGRAGAGQLDDPAALGPRRGERLRLPHGPRPAARTRPRRRCCCTRRSATTR